MLFGILTGALSCRFRIVGEFLEPPIQFMKSIPVASFVILALIWTGSKNLSILISSWLPIRFCTSTRSAA